jgi:hypothetical protein
LLDKKISFEKQMNLLPYEVRVWEVKKPRASLGFMNPF